MQQQHNPDSRPTAGPSFLDKLPFYSAATARWDAMEGVRRGVILVSLGSLTLVVMATLVKFLGERVPAMEIFFFRSVVGFFLVVAVLWRDPFEPLRTKRPGMHFVRGAAGAVGNACFFWTLTNMLLADAMALQFSRPLFMIPLAVFFLGEVAGWRRTGVTLAGFLGILIYARPFTAGFEPGVFIGALGAFTGGLVVICIKRLQTTEKTSVIMFYYAFWNTLIAAVPAAIWWVTPTAYELMFLVLVGVVGISGQALITHGLSQGDATVLVPLDYSRIVYSAIIGYLLFSEVPGPWSFAGMALIVGASMYLVLTEKRRQQTAPAQPE
ncbi:MAG TPA: DMT family transporter [Xanthobacteraceae bacterium]|nr:DMT family transporter [Xanthobacteraceae bacterium]